MLERAGGDDASRSFLKEDRAKQHQFVELRSTLKTAVGKFAAVVDSPRAAVVTRFNPPIK